MRTISATQQAVLDAGVQADHVRVSVKDGGGTFRDLGSYPGFNSVKSVTWKESVDDPHMTCEVTLLRELHLLSLSPFVQASALNRGFDPAVAFSALIAINREVKVEVALTSMDSSPASGDWFEVFRGRIDSSDAAKGEELTFTCRGLSGRLAQQFIKTELVYSFAADGNAVSLRVWEPQIPVVAGVTYLLPATRGDDDPGVDKFFICGATGTTGTEEPVWTTGTGIVDGSADWDYVDATTTGGNPVEEVIQNILDDNKQSGDSTVTLYVPASPGWAIRQFIQSRTFTLDAVRTLAGQIGWDLRYKWRSGTAQFEFTLYEPPRVAPSVVFTFARSDYKTPDTLSVDIAEIRNSWRVIYADRTDLFPDGTPKRKRVEVQDSASITKYGELWAEIQEDETSNIDSSTEATTLANAALSDCAEPTAVFGVELERGFPWTELNDYYTFSADQAHFDQSLSLAVTGWTQTFEAGHLKTKLQLRGLPTAGARVHLEKTAHPLVPPTRQPNNHALVKFQGPKTAKPNFLDVVGGTRIQLDIPLKDKNRLLSQYEVHVYPTPGSDLDDTTLVGVTMGQDLVMPELIPGETYYSRTVERGFNVGRLVRGQPSAEQSFVAGRASAGHIHGGILLGNYPLNNGFETRVDTAGMPDHWSIVTGNLGTQVVVLEDGNGLSGNRYMKLAPDGTAARFESAKVPFDNEMPEANRYSGLFRVVAWMKNDAGNGASNYLNIELYGYDYADTYVDTLGAISIESNSKVGHWQRVQTILKLDHADSTNRDVRSLGFDVNATRVSGTPLFYLDRVEMQYLGTYWYAIGDTSKYTDAYESIPGFSGTWVNFTTGASVAAFRRNQLGRIFLKGHIKDGTINTAAFTLPATFWPPYDMYFDVMTNTGYGELKVSSAGVVTPVSGGTGRVSLDNVSFETFS